MQKERYFAFSPISDCHSRFSATLRSKPSLRSTSRESIRHWWTIFAGMTGAIRITFNNCSLPRKSRYFFILILAFATSIFAAPSAMVLKTDKELPSATEILAQVRASLPREALLIKGQILSGGRLGKLERVCYIDMFLDFGADPAIVRYKISDAFGTAIEQMTISMTEGGETEYEYEAGNPLKSAPAPQPTGVIMDTDVTWNDLSLLFLWRSDGRTAREENLRGRDSYVLEFPRNEGGIQSVWIDMQMLVLIQMEELDSGGRPQRRMIVKNIKKISDQWMIKNLEIRAYPSLHHTLIKVDEVISM